MVSLTDLEKNEGALAIRTRLKVAQVKVANDDNTVPMTCDARLK